MKALLKIFCSRDLCGLQRGAKDPLRLFKIFFFFFFFFYLLNSVSYSSSIETFFVGGNTSRKGTVHRKQEHFRGHDIYIQ